MVSLFPHPASFGFRLATDTLAFGYLLPAAGRIRVFHPLETCAAGRTQESPPLVEDFLHSEGLLNRLFSQRVITGRRFSRLHSKAISTVVCKDGFGDGYHFVIRGSLDWAKTLLPQGFSPLQRSLPLAPGKAILNDFVRLI